jgi:hypothetical protein
MLLWTGIIPCSVLTFAITLESCCRRSVGKVRRLPVPVLLLLLSILVADLVLVNILLFLHLDTAWTKSVNFMVDVALWGVLITSYSYSCNGITVFRTNYWTVKLTYVYKLV